MRGRKTNPSPDYFGWQELTTEVGGLPPKKFYFVVTMIAFALIAYMVSDSKVALTIAMLLMLVFALCVFAMHRRNDDGKNEQDRSS